MSLTARGLKVVPAEKSEPRRCALVCHATIVGAQEITVRLLTPASGPEAPRIGVRLGSIVLVISERQALNSLGDALREAEQVAEIAFNGSSD